MSEILSPKPSEEPLRPEKDLLIFLAEDDPDDVYLFERALPIVDGAHRLRVYENGQDLIDALRSSAPVLPDIVFLDINMPVQTGLECLLMIREHHSKTVPVFLLSTAQDRLTIEQARKMGATGYLSKPTFVKDLGSLLSNVLSIDWQSRSENDFYVHLQFAGT